MKPFPAKITEFNVWFTYRDYTQGMKIIQAPAPSSVLSSISLEDRSEAVKIEVYGPPLKVWRAGFVEDESANKEAPE